MIFIVICLIGISFFFFLKFDGNGTKQNKNQLTVIGIVSDFPLNHKVAVDQENNKIPSNENDAAKEIDNHSQENPMQGNSIQLTLVQSVQENNYFCVPACLQMVLRYKGIEKTQTELSKEMKTDPVTGTEYIDLARVANKYLFHNESIGPNDAGYHIQTLNRYDTDSNISLTFEKRVRLDISTNDPVFVAIDVHTLYPQLPSGNHMIIITGYATYSDSENIAYYYYIDPYYMVQDNTYGGLKTVTKEQLMKAIVVNEEPAYIW